MTTQLIQLSKLQVSAANASKAFSKAAVDEMRASLQGR